MGHVQRAGLSVVLGITLILNPVRHAAEADDQKTNQAENLKVPEEAMGIPASVVVPFEAVMKAVDQKDWATAETQTPIFFEKEPGLTPLRFGYANALRGAGSQPRPSSNSTKRSAPSPISILSPRRASFWKEGPKTRQPPIPRSQPPTCIALDAVNGQTIKKASEARLHDVAELALRFSQTPQFDKVVGELRARFPAAKETHYYRGIQAAQNQSWLVADDEAARARAMGCRWRASSRDDPADPRAPNRVATHGSRLTRRVPLRQD